MTMAQWPGTPDPVAQWPGTPESTAQAWPGTPDAPERPGLVDYGREVAKQVGVGIGEFGASYMRGLSQDQPLPGEMESIASQALPPGTMPPPPKAAAVDLSTLPTYQVGERISKAIGSDQPSPILHPIATDVARGFGSMIAGIPTSVLGGPLLAERGEAAQRAVEAKATPEQQALAQSLGSVAGATEFADMLLLSAGSAGRAAGLLRRVGANVLRGVAIEGGQEGLQRFIQNLIARGVYKPEQDLSEGVAYEAMIGGILGGGVRGVGSIGRPREEAAATSEEAYQATIGTESIPPTAPQTPTPGPLDPPQPPPTEMAVPTDIPTPAGPTTTENYHVNNPDAGLEGLEVQVQRGADGGLVSFQPSMGRIYVVPPEYRFAPVAPLLAQKYGPRDNLDFRNVTRIDPIGDTNTVTVDPSTIQIEPQGTPRPLPDASTQKLMDRLEDVRPMREEEQFQVRSSANVGALASVLSSNLYGDPGEMAFVTMKEMYQNAFDAIKDTFALGRTGPGNISIDVNPRTRTITMTDDGIGMPKSVMSNEFVSIAGSKKVSSRASGGLGIAKMMVLLENQNIQVMSMHKGKVTETTFSGPQFRASFDDPSQALSFRTRDPTEADKRLFPQGHGTSISVTIPTSWKDEGGEAKGIHFPSSPYADMFPSLRLSPLLENINVSFNGEQLPTGANFPASEYVPFANTKFGWGDARIIVSANEQSIGYYNTHVLSNGIWQFSMRVEAQQGEPIPRQIYIDVSPKVTPRQPGYPFELNRQGFSPKTRKDFDRVLHAVRMMFQRVDLVSDAQPFGAMEYLDFDEGRVVNTGQFRLHLPEQRKDVPSAIRNEGNNITVHEGVLSVNGRAIPELSGDQLENMTPDSNDLKIPQDQISSDRIILHDNVAVTPTGAPLYSTAARISLTQYGVMKHGQRFYDYIYGVGNLFREMRDVVAWLPPTERVPSYTELKGQALGLSLDKEYHGVSIRIPFSGSFLNPFLPKFADPQRAAAGMWQTMLHEFAHLTHRSETGLAPFIQDLTTRLMVEQGEFLQGWLGRFESVISAHQDVLTDIRSLFNEGSVEPAGRSFEVGNEQRTDAGLYRDVDGQPTSRAPKGAQLRDWVAISESSVGQRTRSTDGNLKTSTTRDPSFGRDANERALRTEVGHDDVAAYQRTGPTTSIRGAIGRVFGGNVPPSVQAQAAHADRINWLYEYSAGLLELRQANPAFTPVVRYTEITQLRDIEESRWQSRGVEISKAWRALGRKQGDILADFLNDLANMTYLTPQERAQGIKRWPTPTEFTQLTTKHKTNAQILAVYRDVMQHFHAGLQLETQNAIDHATRTITDPVKLSNAINQIRAWEANLRGVPYFPFMRFGRHFVTVRNPVTNGIEFFELYERHGVKSAKKVQQTALKKIKTQFPTYPDSAFTWGVLPPDVSPLMGLSPQLLEQMKNTMQLSQTQLDALEQLQYQMSPALSFKHRFQHKSYVPGYSRDFLRAFAHWSFHNARYHANAKYVWELEEQIKEAGKYSGDKETRIRNYMVDHLQNTLLNIKGDHGKLRGIAFFFHLGFSPASAFYNMYSIATNAWSHLASHYGNVKTTTAMLKAMGQVSTFYRRGNLYGATDFQLSALGYGILTGRVSETQSAELAGLANGNGLIFGVAGNNTQRAIQWAQEKAAFFFENAEQFVRRTTYRAALDLAMNDPTNKGVREAVGFSPREQQNLVAGVNTGPSRRSFSPQEANAIVYANETVDRTAYVYKRWAKPRIMRHPIGGNVLIFYRFIQAMVFAFMNGDRGYRTRWLLTTLAIGGLMAVPGWEEFKGIIQGIMKKSGLNVDIDTEMSRYILQWSDGTVPPDIILHGNARRGFHVPAILDMMGSFATGRPGRGYLEPGPGTNVPFPMLDLSKGATPRLSPVDIGKLMTPYQSTDKAIAEASQRAAGAAFSPAFNLYHALMNTKMESDDFKRWERVLPRAFAGVSKAFRIYAEERERSPRGGPAGAKTQLTYDVRDTEQLMEIVFQGLGFTTLRQSREWDFTKAKLEHAAFVKGSREGIMAQFYEAVMSRDPDEMESVKEDIRKFNEKVSGTPDAAYVITAEGLRTSLRNRIQERTLSDQGLAREKRQIPIIQDLRQIYPKAVSDKVIDIQRR